MTAAALTFNRGAAFISKTFKTANGKSPGELWKVKKNKKMHLQTVRKEKRRRPLTSTPKERVVARRITFKGSSDKDYGIHANTLY